MSVAWLHAVAINLNGRPRSAAGGMGLRDAIDRLKGTLRSYISAGLVSRLYADASQTRSRETPPDTSVAPRSEHGKVLAELHLTSNLTSSSSAASSRWPITRTGLHLPFAATRRGAWPSPTC